MNSARVDKEGDVVVLEIKPNNPTLRIVFSIVLTVVVLLGVWLAIYAVNVFSERAFWFNSRLILLLLAYFFFFFILFRHWAWFNKGKEVVVVYKEQIVYYRDLFLFAEGKTKTPYEKIEVIYRKDKASEKDYDENLVDEDLVKKESVIVGFRVDDKEVIGTNLPISLNDVQRLTNLLERK